MNDDRLVRTLTLWPAVGLAITLVIGGGILVIPGLAYDRSGAAAVWSWVLAAGVTAPLLVIVADLGSRFPNAGGIAGFVEPTLGKGAARVAQFLLLAAMTGGAALCVVGGDLVGDWVGTDRVVLPTACAVLGIAVGVAMRGTEFAGTGLKVLSAIFVMGLAIIGVAGAVAGHHGVGNPSLGDIASGIDGLGLVFFAFVGWEMMATMTEEFLEPRRDFPRTIAISFVVVSVAYLAVALAVQRSLAADDPAVLTSPVASVAEVLWGGLGRSVVTTVGLAIVMTNVVGVVIAFSRVVYATARARLLPARLTVTDRRGTPTTAIAATGSVFAAGILLEQAGVVDQATLFELAASAFFASFVLAACAYIAANTSPRRYFGVIALVISVVALGSLRWFALYPVAVASVALLTSRRTPRQPSSSMLKGALPMEERRP
ncbi:MAG: APC family permease [Actinobacteria bacterium]|nr:APC family permease [Actinomycetota bacterium]